MGGILRRASGVYVARLTVPERHRQSLGKLEFIASTGTREIAVARIVAGQLVAEWRRRLHSLDRLNAGMDVLQLSLGSPLLLVGGLPAQPHAGKEMSEAVDGFMADRSKPFRPDQAGRIRGACLLFVELEGEAHLRR